MPIPKLLHTYTGTYQKKNLNHMHGHINRYTGTATRVAIHISTRVHTVRTVYIFYARAYIQSTRVQQHGLPQNLARARTSIPFLYPSRKLLHGQLLSHEKRNFIVHGHQTDMQNNDYAKQNNLRQQLLRTSSARFENNEKNSKFHGLALRKIREIPCKNFFVPV